MSAMEEAFSRLGFRPSAQPRPPRASVKAHRIETAPNYSAFTDDDLKAEIAVLEQARIVITEEINADHLALVPKGNAWRQAASKARAYKVAHLKLARDEYDRRHPPAVVKKEAARAAVVSQMEAAQALAEARAREKAAIAEEHNARVALARANKEAAVAQRDLVWQKRQARRARMFLMAADQYLSKQERAWLWDAARQMFPDDPVWD